MWAVLNLFSISWWLQYCLDNYQREASHVVIEVLCWIIIAYVTSRKPYNPHARALSKDEEDALIAEWTPEPLEGIQKNVCSGCAHCESCAARRTQEPTRVPFVVESAVGPYVQANGKQYLNFSASNFLGLTDRKEIKEACERTIEKYGVGSCGPRGFYGSIDVHIKLEKDIADFLGVKDAIVYSDGIASISSIIPAFSKRDDLIICDEGVQFSIRQGIRLSRSNVLTFKHNDPKDLERVLDTVRQKDLLRPRKKLNRRFIVVEGIYQNYGDITPLHKIVKLAKEYKYRLILDDSLAIGVLGATGRGSIEHFNVPVSDVDILCGGLEHALGTVGGFCVGSPKIVDHQRLSGAGYVFSASAPPYCCTAGSEALRIMQAEPTLVQSVRDKALLLRKAVASIPGLIPISTSECSPVVHLRVARPVRDDAKDRSILQRVADELLDSGVIVSMPEYVPSEPDRPAPSIRLIVTAAHSESDIARLGQLLSTAFGRVFSAQH